MSETEAEYQARLTAWKRSYGKGPRPVRKPPGLLDSAISAVKGMMPTGDWTRNKNADINKARKEAIERKLKDSGA